MTKNKKKDLNQILSFLTFKRTEQKSHSIKEILKEISRCDFVCEKINCCSSFNSIETYEQHCAQENHQPSSKDTIKIYQSVIELSSKDGQNKSFLCGGCRNKFSTEKILHKHIKDVCVGTQIFTCDLCKEYMTASYLDLLKH